MAAPSTTVSAAHTYELDRAHVFHSWSAQQTLDPMVIEDAAGCEVWDGAGRRYLDFSSQLVYTNVGHQHPRVVEAIQQQAAKLCTIAPAHANAARSQAAHLIAQIAPEGMDRVFFTSGGADANEHAVRMARLHTGRYKVLSAFRSYHGATAQTINLSGDHRRWPNDHGNSGVVHFHGPFLYRSEFHAATEEQECERALAHLDSLIRFEGPDAFAALIIEPVPGTSGIMPPPPGYLPGVRAICDRYGIVMICDEVMAGFGRTGGWLALDHYGAVPDLITFAKGVNSGYVPLGGVIVGERIYRTFAQRAYPGGLTYSGHPLACAAAVATIETMHAESIVENAEFIGRTALGPGLRELARRHPSVGEVRGLGVFWALDLVTDRETREPLSPYGGTNAAIAQTMSAAREQGLLLFNNYHRIHVVPPCIVTPAEISAGLAMLDRALDVADSFYTGAR
ncbi:MAG: Taurine--pyruvate aminotransferase [Nocardia sp.]|uniref:aspartate aminotransferase family protein n=1 Tax=Nocardia sp. TaxID=1821 RepID=UPI00260F02E5|nr:aspartate aminotransferase family protein [Nocardia sp.]MCU1642267.1 Taurine--pyruvate aminotransferase [Nocardia sp.]